MTLYYNNKKVSALHKVYLGDKLVFGGGGRPNISVRTYDESMAEQYPNGLCGTISFDSEMNVSSVT